MGILQNVYIKVKDKEYKTYEDWGLILKKKSISSPQPDIKQESVPCRNGLIDYTEIVTGNVTYQNRSVAMSFLLKDVPFEILEHKIDIIRNAIHGRKVSIIFEDDIAFYWLGRIEVEWKITGNGVNPQAEVKMIADVEPYKYSVMTNDEDWLWNPFDFDNDIINRTMGITIPSGEMLPISIYTMDNDRTQPLTFISDSDKIVVTVGGKEYNLNKGSTPIYDYPLRRNRLYFFEVRNNGITSATVSINYIGGML